MRSFTRKHQQKKESKQTGRRVRRICSAREAIRETCPVSRPASQLSSPITNAEDVLRAVKRELASSEVEVFLILHLDTKHQLKSVQIVSLGSLTECLVHPREVFCEAVRQRSQAVIACHNHPSGDPEPSREDLDLTTRLYRAGELLGIPLLDHVIVGQSDRFLSLAAIGFIGSSGRSAADRANCYRSIHHGEVDRDHLTRG